VKSGFALRNNNGDDGDVCLEKELHSVGIGIRKIQCCLFKKALVVVGNSQWKVSRLFGGCVKGIPALSVGTGSLETKAKERYGQKRSSDVTPSLT
jgi:hypothetical protein